MSDPPQVATEAGARDVDASTFPADVGKSLDAAIDTLDAGTRLDATADSRDVVANPDAATDSREVGLTTLDLGTNADGSVGSEASLPTGCDGQDLYVDVSDGHTTTRLVYSGSSAIPLATGNGTDVSIVVSENPNGGGAKFYVDLAITGPRSATTTIVSWTPAGQSTSMTDHCGSGKPVTITHFDASGGILEDDFDHIAVGYSCEGIDAPLSGHFRVCYVPTS